MPDAAHPQPDADTDLADASGPEPAGIPAVKNPFPATMTVPGVDGTDIVVDLAVIDGVVYAPGLATLPVTPYVHQYVTQYCAAWSSSVLTSGTIDDHWKSPPRRVQVVFREDQLHAMLGLADDERLVRTVVDDLGGTVRFVVESPRLPPLPAWNAPPVGVGLPVSAWYENRRAAA